MNLHQILSLALLLCCPTAQRERRAVSFYTFLSINVLKLSQKGLLVEGPQEILVWPTASIIAGPTVHSGWPSSSQDAWTSDCCWPPAHRCGPALPAATKREQYSEWF